MQTERTKKAKELFKSGYNCSQSVVLAYADLFGLDNETAEKIGAGFGGGMGRMREVCGAFSGLVILAGLKEEFRVGDSAQKKELYKCIQDMAEAFKEQNNGSFVCRDLLGLSCQKDSPVPSERTQEYYKKRPCADIIEGAAEIAEKFLLNSED